MLHYLPVTICCINCHSDPLIRHFLLGIHFGKMPISGKKNSAKNETFGSKLTFSIGGTLLKTPIKICSDMKFSLQFDGEWVSRSSMKTYSNPNSLRYFQRHFSSQIPNQSQVKFDIFPTILWGFGGAEAQ